MSRYDEVLELLDEILQLEPTHTQARDLRKRLLARQQVEELFRRGRRACREADLAHAEALLHEALNLHPNHDLILRWYKAVQGLFHIESARQRLVTQAAVLEAQGDYLKSRHHLDQAFVLVGGKETTSSEDTISENDDEAVPRLLPLSKAEREAMHLQYKQVMAFIRGQADNLIAAGKDELQNARFEEASKAFGQAASLGLDLDPHLKELQQKARSGIEMKAEAQRLVVEASASYSNALQPDAEGAVQDAGQPSDLATLSDKKLELLRSAVSKMPEFIGPDLSNKQKQFLAVCESLRVAQDVLAGTWSRYASLTDGVLLYDDVKKNLQELVCKAQEPGALLERQELADDRWPGLRADVKFLRDLCGLLESCARTFARDSYKQLAESRLKGGRLEDALGFVNLALQLDPTNDPLLALSTRIRDRQDVEKKAKDLRTEALARPIASISDARGLLQQALQLTEDEILKRELDSQLQIALQFENAQSAFDKSEQNIKQGLYPEAIECLETFPETIAADSWQVIKDTWPALLEKRTEALGSAKVGQEAISQIATQPEGGILELILELTRWFGDAAQRLPEDKRIGEFHLSLLQAVYVRSVLLRLLNAKLDEPGVLALFSKDLALAREVAPTPRVSTTWLGRVLDEMRQTLHRESRTASLSMLGKAIQYCENDRLDAAETIMAQVQQLMPLGEIGIIEQIKNLETRIANERRSKQLFKEVQESGSDKLDGVDALLAEAQKLTQVDAHKTCIAHYQAKRTRLLEHRTTMEKVQTLKRSSDYDGAVALLETALTKVEPEQESWPAVDRELTMIAENASKELERAKRGLDATQWMDKRPEGIDLARLADELKGITADFPQDARLAEFHEAVRQVAQKDALVALANQQARAMAQDDPVASLDRWRSAVESKVPVEIKPPWLGSLAQELGEQASQGMQSAMVSIAGQAELTALSGDFDKAMRLVVEVSKRGPTHDLALGVQDVRNRTETAQVCMTQCEEAAKAANWLKALAALEHAEAAFAPKQCQVIAPRRTQLQHLRDLSDAEAIINGWLDDPYQATDEKLSEYKVLAENTLPPADGSWPWLNVQVKQMAVGIEDLIKRIRDSREYEDRVRTAHEQSIKQLAVEGDWLAAREAALGVPSCEGIARQKPDLIALRERLVDFVKLADVLNGQDEDRFGKAWSFMQEQKLAENVEQLAPFAQQLKSLDACMTHLKKAKSYAA